MITEKRIFFVIPAYNEAENLPHLLDNIWQIGRFFNLNPTVIVVNDGSTDQTLEVIAECGRKNDLIVVNHEANQGPGMAFKSGFLRALEEAEDKDIVATIEADNTSDLCVLGRMMERLSRGNDIVLASVYGQGHIVGSTTFRRVMSFSANTLMKTVFRIPQVNTFTSFFRMYRVSALQKLFSIYGDSTIQETGFTCMLEMLVKFHLMGCSIGQVPILLDSKMRIGESKMKVVKNINSTLALIRRYVFSGAYRPPAKSTKYIAESVSENSKR